MAQKALGRLSIANELFKLSTEEEGDFIDMAVSAYSELSYYSALSFEELGKKEEAIQLWKDIKDYALKKLQEAVKIDYFATSLPQLLVFEDDLQKRNEWDSKYLLALAELGMKNKAKAFELFKEVFASNSMHQGAKLHLETINSKTDKLQNK